MRNRILLSTLLLATLGYVSCQAPSPTPAGCYGKKNVAPVLELEPQALKTVPNGQSWVMQEGTNVLYIAKVKGTAYEMGYAYGQLFGQEVQQNIQNILNYAKSKVQALLSSLGVSELMSELIISELEPVAYFLLDLNWQVASPYIPQRYVDEIKGMADGSNGLLTESLLRRANMIPELTQAACTIVGAYGPATIDGKIYHLRALDWEPTATVNQYPSIIIYEPSEPGSNTFANIGYMGLIGTLTAMSKKGISMGQKVFIPNTGFYPEKPYLTYIGKPWNFVLRDTVQFSNNIFDAQSILTESKRTMMIHLGIGSAPDKTFRGADYAANYVKFYSDTNFTYYDPQAHPQMNGIFFYDEHTQPSGDTCTATILRGSYGKITPETLYSDVAGYQPTGNAKVVVMDPEGQQIWLSYSQFNAPVNGFERSPIHVKLYQFWGDSNQTTFIQN